MFAGPVRRYSVHSHHLFFAVALGQIYLSDEMPIMANGHDFMCGRIESHFFKRFLLRSMRRPHGLLISRSAETPAASTFFLSIRPDPSFVKHTIP